METIIIREFVSTYLPSLLESYWEILALDRFCMDFGALARHCHDLARANILQYDSRAGSVRG